MILIIVHVPETSYTAWRQTYTSYSWAWFTRHASLIIVKKYEKYETYGMKSQDSTTVALQQDKVSLDFTKTLLLIS